MKKLSEGHKMWLSVMAVFVVYGSTFILFEDYDRKWIKPFSETSDWHLLEFSLIVMIGLGALLYHFARGLDQRITKEQLEKEKKVRRELTQNIAHELKTPVACILGYTETILDSPHIDDQTRTKFIEHTYDQARRLTSLLKDVSILNRMDYAADMIAMENVNVTKMVDDIIQGTAFAFERKKMKFINNLPKDITVKGNASLIYSIFHNLIDNSLNYSGEGSTVTVGASNGTTHWHFTFEDNGKGVDKSHLSRMFERFYIIDNSHDKDYKGTGLGLPIVKNAVQFHGGTINASIPKNGGLKFEFALKKK